MHEVFRLRLIVNEMDFLVSSLQIHSNYSCVKYASYELRQMKEEDLSFPNKCHLVIINVTKLW